MPLDLHGWDYRHPYSLVEQSDGGDVGECPSDPRLVGVQQSGVRAGGVQRPDHVGAQTQRIRTHRIIGTLIPYATGFDRDRSQRSLKALVVSLVRQFVCAIAVSLLGGAIASTRAVIVIQQIGSGYPFRSNISSIERARAAWISPRRCWDRPHFAESNAPRNGRANRRPMSAVARAATGGPDWGDSRAAGP
jgi:hypothetical protein